MKAQPPVCNPGASVPGEQPKPERPEAERETSVETRVYWEHSALAPITSFVLEKSVNKGASYTTLATIVFSTTGANYDSKSRRFFYTDSAGQAGAIYRITSVGTLGTSEPAFAITPPAAMLKCLIIGYVRDSYGNVDTNMRVLVSSYGTRGEAWAYNATGVVANEALAVGVPVDQSIIVQPNAEGIWRVELLRKTLARIQIPDLNFEWAFEVPDAQGPINIRDIPQLRGADFSGLWPGQDGVRKPISLG